MYEQQNQINFSYSDQSHGGAKYHVSILGLKNSFEDTPQKGNSTKPVIDFNESQEAIYITEHLRLDTESEVKKPRKMLEDQAAVAKFEIFESSSDDELSQGAYESAAQSYQKKLDRQLAREEDGFEGEDDDD